MMLIIVMLFAVTMAQRPGYLAGPTYPQLASRFRTDNDETTTTNLNNRLGEIDGTTEKIPVDARGDADLVHRIQEWPRQNMPYWYLNAEHIERQRNPQGTRAQNSVGQQQSRILEDSLQAAPEVRLVNLNSRFGDYYDLGSRYAVNDVVPIFVRLIRPVATRPFFAGSL